jgi:hypothetical protein
MTALCRATQLKLAEYRTAQERYGLTGPHLIREAAFLHRRLTTLLNRLEPSDTVDLLYRWRKLQALVEIHRQTENELLELRGRKTLTALKTATETFLKRPSRLEDVRFLAKLINPNSQ